MEKKKRETEGKGEDPAGTAFPHGSHSTCKVEPERAEPGQNSRGLVNRTIVKHLPSFPFIYIYICIFFFSLSFFLLVLLHPKRVAAAAACTQIYAYLWLFSLYKETALECINKWIPCHRRTALGGRRGRAAGVTNYFKLERRPTRRIQRERDDGGQENEGELYAFAYTPHFACLSLYVLL